MTDRATLSQSLLNTYNIPFARLFGQETTITDRYASWVCNTQINHHTVIKVTVV